MTTRTHHTKEHLHYVHEGEDDVTTDDVTTDDLRMLIKQLEECWQLGDTNVMREARSALLVVFRNSATRLLGDYHQAIRTDL